MGVTIHGGTMTGGVTPTCNACGVALCWDIPRVEHLEAKAFWDAWKCQDCNGSRLSAFGWKQVNGREALPAEVEAAIVAFDLAHPALDARDFEAQPDDLSGLFVEALKLDGIEARTSTVAEVRGRPHVAVAVGDFTIDWSAARHDEDAPVPLVYRTSLGWPIEPASTSELLEHIANLDPDAFEALLTKALARKQERDAPKAD
jgi:hypothetical protein